MSKNGAYLVKPLRIALLCASALMLTTAFAEDGSNLSDIQYHPGSDSGRVVNSGMDRWVTPADLDGDGSQLRELQYHPGIDGLSKQFFSFRQCKIHNLNLLSSDSLTSNDRKQNDQKY